MTYSNFLSNSKVGLPWPSTESISAWAFFILEGFCNLADKDAWAMSHLSWEKKWSIDKNRSWKRMYREPIFMKLTMLYQKLVMKNHTCASRKTAQVRTAAVVSWPAISIVIRSSRSCPKSMVDIYFILIGK